MKILCFIDNLGSGGAQRQLTTLADGLKNRGHQIRFLVYHPQDHFLPALQAADIPCEVIPPCSHGKRLLAVRRILRQGWQDVVLALLEGPCLYAELARFPCQHWGLVAGERLADPKIMTGSGRWFRHFHRLADAVVCNSHTNRLMLEAEFPCITKKLTTIYNTVDLQLFQPAPRELDVTHHTRSEPYRIVVAAGYHAKKNMMGVAMALLLIQKTPTPPAVVIDWYGAIQADPSPFEQVKKFVADNDLSHCLRLHPPTKTIEREYAGATAVGLFSFFEGVPNVICEAMACGKPVLLSNVCDAGNLVQDGKNGFLCDPGSPDDIADKILRLVTLPESERQRMGDEARKMAERLFREDEVIARYEHILATTTRHEAITTDGGWPSHVPESATMSVKQWMEER